MSYKDLVVKTGSYTDRDGNEKARFENIGRLMEGKDGPYLLLKRTFNPAGVSVEPGRDSIIVSVFEPREQGGRPASQGGSGDRTSGGANQARGGDPDADIPFAPHERRWPA